jgi:hypothetical protein
MKRPAGPAIGTLQAAAGYVATLPIDDPVLFEQGVLGLLDRLLRIPPPPDILFAVLELLRPGVGRIVDQIAAHYGQRPIPLVELDALAFLRGQALLQRMAQTYALCAQRVEMPAATPEARQLLAEVLQRSLHYNGRLMFEHYRARRELARGCWLAVHAAYKVAEELGVADLAVIDEFMTVEKTNCQATYAAILLCDLAGLGGHSGTAIDLARRWAELWSARVRILVEHDDEAPLTCVRLDQDAAPGVASDSAEDINCRYLDYRKVGREARHALARLRKGTRPQQLRLGEEAASKLMPVLQSLVAPWSHSLSPRRFRRFAASGVARVATGFEAIYAQITGQPFVGQVNRPTYSRGDHVQLHIFRDKVQPAREALPQVQAGEQWQVLNHSANGFRLRRDGPGAQLLQGQLVAVCPHDSQRFMLAHVTWLVESQQGSLLCGLCVLPGLPEALAVRVLPLPGEASTPPGAYSVAFKLPAINGLADEASLVLPLGLYHASRWLDLRDNDGSRQLRMLKVLQRGGDFDRVSFSDA